MGWVVGLLTGVAVGVGSTKSTSKIPRVLASVTTLFAIAIANRFIAWHWKVSFTTAILGVHGEGIVLVLPFLLLAPWTAWRIVGSASRAQSARAGRD